METRGKHTVSVQPHQRGHNHQRAGAKYFALYVRKNKDKERSTTTGVSDRPVSFCVDYQHKNTKTLSCDWCICRRDLHRWLADSTKHISALSHWAKSQRPSSISQYLGSNPIVPDYNALTPVRRTLPPERNGREKDVADIPRLSLTATSQDVLYSALDAQR